MVLAGALGDIVCREIIPWHGSMSRTAEKLCLPHIFSMSEMESEPGPGSESQKPRGRESQKQQEMFYDSAAGFSLPVLLHFAKHEEFEHVGEMRTAKSHV
jgi:hypothetical protein